MIFEINLQLINQNLHFIARHTNKKRNGKSPRSVCYLFTETKKGIYHHLHTDLAKNKNLRVDSHVAYLPTQNNL